VKVGDVIQVKEKSRQIPCVLQAVQTQERPTPEYLEVDNKECSAKFLATPKLADIPYPIQMEPHLVVEFYSR
jgi:small subunit ribosomal protein S4